MKGAYDKLQPFLGNTLATFLCNKKFITRTEDPKIQYKINIYKKNINIKFIEEKITKKLVKMT